MKYKPTYWIVEHAAYGGLAKWDWTYKGNDVIAYPKFQWSGLRSESIHHLTLDEAKKALEKCRQSGRKGMRKCYIVEMSSSYPYAKIIES